MSGDSLDDAALKAGRWLFAQQCDFLISAVGPEQVPDSEQAEIAFAGRSNVGKSSLVNALTGRKTLAKTSNTPGRTRQLNFFDLGGKLMMVDLPGYGYAQAGKKDIKTWTQLTRSYLKGRPQLRRVILLIDSRHGIKPSDREVMEELDEAAVSYQVVLTKVDKLKKGELEAIERQTAEELRKHPASHPLIIATSAEKGDGLDLLRACLAELAEVIL